MDTKVSNILYERLFEHLFAKNSYIAQLDTLNPRFSRIKQLTSHCAPKLQKWLADEEKVDNSEKSYISSIAHKIVESDWLKLADLTQTANSQGFGSGIV